MSWDGVFTYLLFDNPVSSASVAIIKKTGEFVVGLAPKQKQQPPTVIKMDMEPLWKLASSSRCFLRLAGISGASAVILGAYGAHSILPDKEKDQNLKNAFETANRYHFFHTFGLLAAPMCRYPFVSGGFFILGLAMFCGSCYYTAITGDNRLRRITPIGGTCFIMGWLAMVL
ncbi:hypothetical protein AAG570_000245 [Ranatra chinensis]|uniref:Transmembrane protein 256 homolog n=1 Tax=Ranatra chinensis TaxID=642074 RepID=A0ABD0YWH5_9HEMI